MAVEFVEFDKIWMLILGYDFHSYILSAGQGISNEIQFYVHTAHISPK